MEPAIIFQIRRAYRKEVERGRQDAIAVAGVIVSSIPDGVSDEVKLACAIQAVEREDYRSWPSDWFLVKEINNVIGDLLMAFANKAPKGNPFALQYQRYLELWHEDPHCLSTITHGLTRRLPLNDRKGFIQELVLAGRRKIAPGDEKNCLMEDKVVHVAMSYKHAQEADKGGTIDEETASEMYKTLVDMPELSKESIVRVWIDQLLHRYKHDGPWYERGFLPYALMRVASVLRAHGGFGIARKRPWIWAETGIALNGNGIYCKREIRQSLYEVMSDQVQNRYSQAVTGDVAYIRGIGLGVVDVVREALINISFWTPDMLEHAGYPVEFRKDFEDFAQWAKAQVVRLRHLARFSLTPYSFQNTLLEDIAWIRSLPRAQGPRQVLRYPFLRLEMSTQRASKLLSLFRAAAKCQQFGNVVEMVSTTSGQHIFCFKEQNGVVFLNVNPTERSDSVRVRDAEITSRIDLVFEAWRTWKGGYCLWDSRFAGKGRPKIVYCGRIFSRHSAMQDRFGEEGNTVDIGGFPFESSSFMIYGLRAEAVYEGLVDDERVFLAESDVLCMKELDNDLQKELVFNLKPEKRNTSISRILRVCDDFAMSTITARMIGTDPDEITDLIQEIEERSMTESNEVLIRRVYVGNKTFLIAVRDDDWGASVFSFDVSIPLPSMTTHLLSFRTGGDVDSTLRKVRLMMGSTEFKAFGPAGLSLGIGERDGSAGLYPEEFSLAGSEFVHCATCRETYSPVNGLLANVRREEHTSGKWLVQWGDLHKCSNDFRLCPGCLNTFSPVLKRICVLFTVLRTRQMRVKWLGLHDCSVVGADVVFVGPVG